MCVHHVVSWHGGTKHESTNQKNGTGTRAANVTRQTPHGELEFCTLHDPERVEAERERKRKAEDAAWERKKFQMILREEELKVGKWLREFEPETFVRVLSNSIAKAE